MTKHEVETDKMAAVRKWPDVIHAFKTEVCNRWKEIDPDDERDWYCLSYGFFIAKGVPIDDVSWLAIHVRYDLQYWGAGK